MASFSAANIDYRIIRIPISSPRLADIIEKFRKTKLAALIADPASFSASHGDELLLSRDVWAQRLAQPFTIFVCVTGDGIKGQEDGDALVEKEWVGMVTLRGPLSHELYRLSGTENPAGEAVDQETRWHLSNLWTSSTHRGRGLAKKMVQVCIEFAASESKELWKEQARVRLIIKDPGSFLRHMYAGMGFNVTGRASLREAYIASGDEGRLPHDTSSNEELIKIWETRFGLIMERVIHCV